MLVFLEEKQSIYYYSVSGLGALAFLWMIVALSIDVWKRFTWKGRVAIYLSFLFLWLISLSIYYFFLIKLESNSEN